MSPNVNEMFVLGMIDVRNHVRANRRRLAIERLLYVMGEINDVIDPENRLDVSSALASLGGDLHDLYRGLQPEWMRPDQPTGAEGNRARGPKPATRAMTLKRCLVGLAYAQWRKLGGDAEEGAREIARVAKCSPRLVKSWRKNLERDHKTLAAEEIEIVEDFRLEFASIDDPAGVVEIVSVPLKRLP
jgi:hypothetical protein